MPQPQRFLLAHIGDVDHVGDRAYGGQQICFVAGLQEVFELEAHVEMVFDGALAAASDNDDIRHARIHRFLDAILDQRLVDQGEHLFRLSFGGGKEARAETGGGKNRFADFGDHRFDNTRT